VSLTPSQLAVLRADIDADPAFDPLKATPDGRFAIAAAYNVIAAPAWTVWRTGVTRQEILQNGFDWTRLDNLSVGKARVWADIFVDGTINPSKPNVRVGIDSVWVGTAADLAVREAVYGHCKRAATRGQKVFSTGTGSGAAPATMQGVDESLVVTFSDVDAALNLP
jgi:hypothetical protein